MILKQFDTKEKSILLVTLMGCFALLYLLFDDSILTDSFTGNESELIGKLTLATGDVRHKNNKDFQWKTAKQERKLFWGDGVFTGGNSRANVELLNGGHLELDPNSLVILTPNQKDLTLDLKFGQFKGDLNGGELKVRMGEEVLTVKSAAGSKTSSIEFGRDAKKNLVINVVKGSVDVTGSNGSRKVASGSNTKVSADGKSLAEVVASPSILRSTASGKQEKTETEKPIRKRTIWKDGAKTHKMIVQLDENGDPVEKPKLDLNWIPNEEGSETIVEVSKDPSFSNILMTKNSTDSSLSAEVDGPGTYYVRVKPAGSTDTPWSPVQSFEVKGREMPPVWAPQLLSQKHVIDPEVTNSAKLQWTPQERAENYVVEYAKDSEFKEILKSEETKEDHLNFVASKPGKTFFRVRGVNSKGVPGDISPVGEILVPPRALSLSTVESREVFGKSPKAPPEVIDVKVSWTQLKTAKQYEVQLSTDPKFKKEVKKFITPTNSGSLKVSEPGDYNVRIRPLAEDKTPTGPFTAAQTFNYTYKIPLAQPVLVEPMANSTMFFQTAGAPFWFVWKKVRQADVYELEVATDGEFKNKIVSKQTANSRFLFDEKVPSGQLYWRVRATNSERQSNWSESRAVKIFSGRRANESE